MGAEVAGGQGEAHVRARGVAPEGGSLTMVEAGSERASTRLPMAAAALVAAAAHVPVTGEHLEVAPYIGWLFVALEVALVAVALALVVRDTVLVWRCAAVVPALAVVAYVASRSVGLPQIGDDVGNWTEPLGVVSVAAEGLMVVLYGLRHLAAEPRARLLPVGSASAILVLGAAATAVGSPQTPATAGMSGRPEASAMSGMHGSAMQGSGYWKQVEGAPDGRRGRTRTYYISSDPVRWNYVPLGHNGITGRPFDDVAKTYVAPGPGRIGPTYAKCLYRGYTDASFAHRQARSRANAYLGMLGPVIHAEVGDTIRVVFRNTCAFPTSVHPHGVFYAKSSEGAPYADGTRGSAKADDAVATGHRHVYVWKVPPRAGPGPEDGSSVMWMYHSHSDEIADTYSGLMGPMVVTREGMARANGTPKDVDREVFEEFFIDNESLSPSLHDSETELGTPPFPEHPEDDEGYEEANLKHSINGYLYGNQPLLTLRRGQHVRWYTMSMGTETDLHTPHWHGNDVTVGGMRMDVVSLLPASMVTADMVPDDVGTWLFHCHVADHIAAGMMTRYRVVR